MDFSSQRLWINALWSLFSLYWLVSAFKLKKTKKRESWGQRFRYVLPLVVAFYLLRRGAHYGLLGARFVPASDTRRGSVLRSPPLAWPSRFGHAGIWAPTGAES